MLSNWQPNVFEEKDSTFFFTALAKVVLVSVYEYDVQQHLFQYKFWGTEKLVRNKISSFASDQARTTYYVFPLSLCARLFFASSFPFKIMHELPK